MCVDVGAGGFQLGSSGAPFLQARCSNALTHGAVRFSTARLAAMRGRVMVFPSSPILHNLLPYCGCEHAFVLDHAQNCAQAITRIHTHMHARTHTHTQTHTHTLAHMHARTAGAASLEATAGQQAGRRADCPR
eukprot:scaffold152623_cov21-Tisochrysis_lutea.AAC.1